MPQRGPHRKTFYFCFLYTSDAADEQRGVDLGCRRIIKKKKKKNTNKQKTNKNTAECLHTPTTDDSVNAIKEIYTTT